MSMRILAADVGTGTQDILLFESGKTIENNFKLVMPSPTVIVAERIKRATERGQAILLTGVTMGGGPSHWAARDHALAGYQVAVTPEAVRAFDLDPSVDGLAIAAFDHGAAPPGISDRRFRFDFIEQTVRRQPVPSAFAYAAPDTPADLTRLRSIAKSSARYLQLSGSSLDAPLLLMDTGSAAALGALEDPLVRGQSESILCNVGNFHTLAFHLVEGQIVGIFEHHTGEIDHSRLEQMLVKLANGTLTNAEGFDTSVHGALILR